MTAVPPVLTNLLVTLHPANDQNVEPLIRWTLDPSAQGPYKQVPTMTVEALQVFFLHSPERQYFLLTRTTTDGQAKISPVF
jgi:hypothetical protein